MVYVYKEMHTQIQVLKRVESRKTSFPVLDYSSIISFVIKIRLSSVIDYIPQVPLQSCLSFTKFYKVFTNFYYVQQQCVKRQCVPPSGYTLKKACAPYPIPSSSFLKHEVGDELSRVMWTRKLPRGTNATAGLSCWLLYKPQTTSLSPKGNKLSCLIRFNLAVHHKILICSKRVSGVPR